MARRGTIWIAVLIVVSLAIGIFWTLRLAPPSPTPWWWGKNPNIHVEVWEPGKDMATVAMTMPKRVLDTMFALGLPADVSAGEHRVHLNSIWRKLERLPRGQKITLEEEGGKILVWIDVGSKPGAPVPATH
jgi:hypothetical protein